MMRPGILGCVVLMVLLHQVTLPDAGESAEVQGRLDTIHGYATDLFPSESTEVALITVEGGKLVRRGSTRIEGRYSLVGIPDGDYLLLTRGDPRTHFLTLRIKVNRPAVAIAPLFIGEMAIGHDGT